MRLLSIDFDYFVKTSAAMANRYFPDGVDLESAITVFTWASHMATDFNHTFFKNLKFDKDALDIIKAYLLNLSNTTPFLVTNSHIHIDKMLSDCFKAKEHVEIVNIDFHHDCYSGEFSCGSWASHYLTRYNADITWVKRCLSDLSGMTSCAKRALHTTTNLESVLTSSFNAVFICRSDSWYPPQFDNKFLDFISFLRGHFTHVEAERSILTSRYPAVCQQAKVLRAYRQEAIQKGINNSQKGLLV